MATKKLLKTASFTDIHFGCKSNSEQHNTDCENFIDWFCDNVRKDPSIDNIVFMGDWFENRSALNVMTMNYSYRCAKKLNDLGLPVFFIIGNHDLYHRHTRALYSTINFQEFTNFIVINEPTVIEDLGVGNGSLVCPYMFHHEYPELLKFSHCSTWWGHFEFKGFVVTGHSVKMPTGPDPIDYTGPKRIFSGHFHKRQTERHVIYIGNTFPTNFGDAGDNNRGMAVYDHTNDSIKFFDWIDCPKYMKVSLSELLDEEIDLYTNSRVKCLIDVPITFEESSVVRQTYMERYALREFIMEESRAITDALTSTDTELENLDLDVNSVDDLVVKMLSDIKSELITNSKLIEIYSQLK